MFIYILIRRTSQRVNASEQQQHHMSHTDQNNNDNTYKHNNDKKQQKRGRHENTKTNHRKISIIIHKN